MSVASDEMPHLYESIHNTDTDIDSNITAENCRQHILINEKYRGDALIQKEYTADFLDKTRRKNTGEIPQYYVKEHHEAIIPPDLFDFVQLEIKRREQNGKHSGVSIFANKIKCGCCDGWYGAKVWHSTDKYRRVIYRCNKKYAHKGQAVQHEASDGGRNQEDFRQSTELFGGCERERDRRTHRPD